MTDILRTDFEGKPAVNTIQIENQINYENLNAEENQVGEYSEEIIVDPDSPNINTIQKAVNLASPYTKIKLLPGFYRESVVIEKPYLEIESANPKDPAYIISQEKPCISIIGLPQQSNIRLTNLHIIYQGLDKEDFSGVEDKLINKYIYSNSNEIEALEINYQISQNIAEGIINENKGIHTAISIFSGNLYMKNCQATLSFITSWSINEIIPCIYIEKSNFFCDRNILIGNREYLTCGVLLNNSNANFTFTQISNFRSSGVMGIASEDNNILIHNCDLKQNLGAGIFLKGNGKIFLEDNILEGNKGLGMKLLDCKKLTVVGNKMKENLTDGAQFINCDGIVMMNDFSKNKGNGIVIETTDDKKSEIRVLKNIIQENQRNGILITGKNNKSTIFSNELIKLNNHAGILIEKNAFPTIHNNIISENCNQGILIVTGSSALILNNSLDNNTKGNISFGGKASEFTIIRGNKIFGSRTEGIYIYRAVGGKILQNEIFNNNDGIVIAESSLTVMDNHIHSNIRTGMIICEQSNPNIVTNRIHNNNFLGMMVREGSKGKFINNSFRMNISQFYLSEDCHFLIQDLKNHNSYEGRIDLAKKPCKIF